MAITINSLTPLNPTQQAGQPITFNVSATETNGGTLTYLWQFSGDGGVTYLDAPGTNNATSYVTSNLTANENGLYVRVKITSSLGPIVNSNEDPNIGNRIISVTEAPFILVLTEPGSTSYTLNTSANLGLIYEATLLNVDNTQSSVLNNMSVQWQYSSDNGANWNTLNNGDVTGTTSYIINTTNELSATNPAFYFKSTILDIVGTSFGINNYQYRPIFTDTTASNSPVVGTAITIIINPIITVFSQPGQAVTDTKQTDCYKTSIANSGEAQLSVSALTSAGTSLSYNWEFRYLLDDGSYSTWIPVDDGTAASGVSRFWMSIQTGYTANTGTLRLQKLIYFEKIEFRCTLSGSSGEIPVTTNSAVIWMTDAVVYPSNIGNKSALEDFYGNIGNRKNYLTYPIESVDLFTNLVVSRNDGLNGTVTMKIQRQDPGSSTWYDISIEVTNSPQYITYSGTPNTLPSNSIDITYTTPALRRDDGAGNQQDNGAKYRVYVTSTAVYTLNGSGSTATKTLTPIISTSDALLTVYRQVFITGQPSNVAVYENQSAAFSVIAQPSSGSTLTYQWQYNTSSSSTGWIDITSANAGTLYSGYNSNLLLVTPATKSMTYKFYRCVIDTPDSLSSSTSSVARLNITDDKFSLLSDIPDLYINEFQTATWSVTAVSLSLGAVTYQWQKSTNYSPSNPSAATWNDISGATGSTYQILSVDSPGDVGYYRCKCTSFGGFIEYTNAAELSITAVEIQIITNLQTSFTVLEGLQNAVTFSIDATATIGDAPTYQWQYLSPGLADIPANWANFGTGYQGLTSTGSSFSPNAFSLSDDGIKVRCALTATSVPGTTYSNTSTITVKRRFTYFADSAIKNVSTGSIFVLDLQPVVTGGSPTYQWYKNNAVVPGETASTLSVSSPVDGDKYKCLIGLTGCTEHRYSRNNADNIVSATSSTYTVEVEVNVVPAEVKPSRYTIQGNKSGAAIGTVICIPKPADYVNNSSATTDDISQWKTSVSGDLSSGSSSSTITSGSVYTANKKSWITDSNYKSPKWSMSDDRFPGFIELRGQWLKKSEFPLLYRVIGDAYGVTSDSFRLPNPYGKKLMGTGNVDNNSGSVSIVPLYSADGNSGGDKNVPGSIGGVWNFIESKQLPPGSPGISSKPDGTAGIGGDPGTFTLGSFVTNGFTEVEGTAATKFSGNYKFTVGPVVDWGFAGVPTHAHAGVSAAWLSLPASVGSCWNAGKVSPSFFGTESEGGEVLSGPAGIADTDRGITHSHGISDVAVAAGNNQSSNESTGIGDTTAPTKWSQTLDLPFSNTSTNPSFNLFLEQAPATLANSSKTIFNSSLKFTLRNNSPLPLLSPYFRLKFLIKAY